MPPRSPTLVAVGPWDHAEFAALQVLLDEQRVGDGFRLYTELEAAQVRGLSDQVNALAEPLSKLTAALVL